jgi:hypothetical protein
MEKPMTDGGMSGRGPAPQTRGDPRGSDINTLARMRSVLSSSSLLKLGAALHWERRIGRPSVHPPYVLLAYGTLARLARSGVRVEYDLSDSATWSFARRILAQTIADNNLELPPLPHDPPRWDHWRWFRDNHLTTDDGLRFLADQFPRVAVQLAHEIGLLRADRRGSFTHPDRERCIYGDGTLVRPIYAPPTAETIPLDDGTTTVVYPDKRTGELLPRPSSRFDPDLQEHHGRGGPVLTHGYVAWHARGPKPYQRVVLAVAHIPAPGQEAATSVQLAGDIRRYAGDGVQAVIYDGAFHGVHLDEVMRRYGWLALSKMPASAPDTTQGPVLFVNASGRKARSFAVGAITHPTPTGRCAHQLAAIDGQVVELGLDEAGDPAVIGVPERRLVKRSRRTDGQYYFNVSYDLTCLGETVTVWLSPHAAKGQDIHRPHHLRIIAPSDPDFQRLYGLRNDAENFHSNLKRTLIADRAMSLGWRRGLVDIYCFSLLNNALTEYRFKQSTAQEAAGQLMSRSLRGGRPPTA